ncbi:GNAT family N-acetyltransferase [Streptomyces sp. SL13]|uniref:GNAT family N-acetyltransferase n=1 Tax=Streptantibioticus silvisoli TaxID=2705255 RepID=A0AA90HEK2_9ACTN|nr:GNAT family N-acetyltransferase [Streptantibioticus silvisoli]MDI5973492.1 GNAT family N-acetyltransferase [Streptantibioticus silvisoli]
MVDELPDRYRAEITDPRTAFAGDAAWVALLDDAAAGRVVPTFPPNGPSKIKRLWTDPDFRGPGIASAMFDAALAHAAENGVDTVRPSVREWRTGAIARYERLGFTVIGSSDERDQLVCVQRAARGVTAVR